MLNLKPDVLFDGGQWQLTKNCFTVLHDNTVQMKRSNKLYT